jgi:ATP-dependent Clp protease adaptor protein ClpS
MGNTRTQGHTDAVLQEKIREPRKARVILLNDDYTSMDFVVRVLIEVFHKDVLTARTIMLAVHERGRGECGVYPLEIAETKVIVVHGMARKEGFPLRCLVELL